MLLAGALGCVSGERASIQAPPPPSFTLTANPGNLQIPAGGSGYALVSVNRANGFTGAVALAVAGLPVGAAASGTIPDTATTGYLTVAVDGSVSPQAYGSLTLDRQAGALAGTAPFALTVMAPLPLPGFSPNLVNAPGGEQNGGSLSNTFLFMEPVAQTLQASGSGVLVNQEGFLPDAEPALP